jgi:peptide/nickel transport system substrate-binding protein/oligopeptide transport system substrate-binding protein
MSVSPRNGGGRRATVPLALITALAAACLAAPLGALPAEAGEALPVQGEFVYATAAFGIELDPHHAYSATEAQLFTALHDCLYTYDPKTLEPLPSLAASMERSKDKRTYIFTIRPGARFSNGDPITAAHVRASWFRIISPDEDAEYSSLFDVIQGARDYRTGTLKDQKKVGIKAISASMLAVTLEHPAAYFLKLLCHHSFSVLHPLALKPGAWDRLPGPPTSGPFVLESLNESEMVLRKNPQYWDAANVRLPSIRAIFSDQDSILTQRYNSGELHWLAGGMDPELLLDRSSIQYTLPMFATSYLFFRCDRKPFSDPRVRQALLDLAPLTRLRDPERYFMPADTLVVALQGYKPKPAALNGGKEAALALLAKAGYPDPASLPEVVLRLGAGEDQAALGDILVQAWSEVGIKVRILKSVGAEYFSGLKAQDYAIGYMTWIGDFADPLTFLQMWGSDSNLNDARFSDPVVDRLLRRSMGQEGQERLDTLAEAERLILESGACVPVSHPVALNVISTDTVGGWASNPLDIHPFKSLFFKAGVALEGLVRASY